MQVVTSDSLDDLLLNLCQNNNRYTGAIVLDSELRKQDLVFEMERHWRENVTPNISYVGTTPVNDICGPRPYTFVEFSNGSKVYILSLNDNIRDISANTILYWPGINSGLVRYLSMRETRYKKPDDTVYTFKNYGGIHINNNAFARVEVEDDGSALDEFLNTFVVNR